MATTPATPATAVPVGSTSMVTATDADNGKTVNVRVGQQLRVTLASTYWQFQPAENGSVLASDGTPTVSPAGTCPVGVGCGTVSAVFVAHGSGTVTVTALRSSCGEAMGCTKDSGTFQVHVHVS